MIASATFYEVGVSWMIDLDKTALETYTEGLFDAWWRGGSGLDRLGYAIVASLRFGHGCAIRSLLSALREDARRADRRMLLLAIQLVGVTSAALVALLVLGEGPTSGRSTPGHSSVGSARSWRDRRTKPADRGLAGRRGPVRSRREFSGRVRCPRDHQRPWRHGVGVALAAGGFPVQRRVRVYGGSPPESKPRRAAELEVFRRGFRVIPHLYQCFWVSRQRLEL